VDGAHMEVAGGNLILTPTSESRCAVFHMGVQAVRDEMGSSICVSHLLA
jgi:hypothetical protein